MVLCVEGDHDKLFCSQSTVYHLNSQRSGPCDETCCHWESVGGVSFKHIICQHTHSVDTLTHAHTHARILLPCTHFGIQGQRIIVSLCVRFACVRMGSCALQTCLQAAWVCAFVLVRVVCCWQGRQPDTWQVCKQVPETPEPLCTCVCVWVGSLVEGWAPHCSTCHWVLMAVPAILTSFNLIGH